MFYSQVFDAGVGSRQDLPMSNFNWAMFMIFHLNSESFWDSCVGRRRRGGRDQEQDESVWGEVSFHPHTFPATHRTTSLLMLHMMRTTMVFMILMEPIVTSISSVSPSISPMKSNLLKTLANQRIWQFPIKPYFLRSTKTHLHKIRLWRPCFGMKVHLLFNQCERNIRSCAK